MPRFLVLPSIRSCVITGTCICKVFSRDIYFDLLDDEDNYDDEEEEEEEEDDDEDDADALTACVYALLGGGGYGRNAVGIFWCLRTV